MTNQNKRTTVTGFFQGEKLELNWYSAYRPEFVPLLLDYIGARDNTSILDVGCGSGFFTRLLAQSLKQVQLIGVDADETMLTLAKTLQKQADLPNSIEFRQGDTYQIPFPDETFDLVTSHTLL